MVYSDNEFDKLVQQNATSRLKKLEAILKTDILFYYGPIFEGYLAKYRAFIDSLLQQRNKKPILAIILHTPGGDVVTVERFVQISRNYYDQIWFLIPNFAMSAGTIWAMSGDRIFMEQNATFGPIDPQVEVNGQFLPALGYLEYVEKLVKKSAGGILTNAELAILLNQDIARLNYFEQNKNLSISLLKKWLVEYKFKDWNTHATNNIGSPVTHDEKVARAEEIANNLNDINKWHVHRRFIDRQTIKKELKLRIEDFENNNEFPDLEKNIKLYFNLILNYIERHKVEHFLHTRVKI